MGCWQKENNHSSNSLQEGQLLMSFAVSTATEGRERQLALSKTKESVAELQKTKREQKEEVRVMIKNEMESSKSAQ